MPHSGVTLNNRRVNISGKPEKIEYNTFSDKKYLKEFTYAYSPVYNKMGPKVRDITNKNMLTQTCADYLFIDDDNHWKPIDANAVRWNKDWNYRYFDGTNFLDQAAAENQPVWRRHQFYTLKSGLTPAGSLINFDVFFFMFDDQFNAHNGWVKTNEITRYSHESKSYESMDIKNRHNSSIFDIHNEKIIATCPNSAYMKSTYSGFENNINVPGSRERFDGEIMDVMNDNYITKIKSNEDIASHTGEYYLQIQPGNGTGKWMEWTTSPNKERYVVSLWTHTESSVEGYILIQLFRNGSNQISEITKPLTETEFTAGNWRLVNEYIDIPDDSYNYTLMVKVVNPAISSEPVYIDDYRCTPVNSPINAYVYDHQTGNITAILNGDNIAEKYEYDNAGRLITIYKETSNGFERVQGYNYHYGLETYFK
jgi:YD repeat-containing protein